MIKTTSDMVFEIATVMAEKKEAAIKKAINYYFKGKPWNEEIVAEIGAFDIYHEGDEVFRMGRTELILFGKMATHVEIDGDQVLCSYHQPYRELYIEDEDL